MDPRVQKLLDLPQYEQRTPEWYEFRQNLFTASSIWKIFGTEKQVNSIIYEKCLPYQNHSFITSNSMEWGTFYEFVSVQLYETIYNTKIEEFGCIRHPDYHFIGASPDGINVDVLSDRYGRMIEVKNIVNREITHQPKEDYWIQMQIQMETCNLNECDFVETRFKEFIGKTDYIEYTLNETNFCKGIILSFIKREAYLAGDDPAKIEKKHEYFFDYNKCETCEYIQSETIIDEWIATTKNKLKNEYIMYSTRFWYLDEFSCILVKRNKLWFDSAIEKIKNVWDIIENEKITGYEHRNTVKKNSITVTVDEDNGSHMIKNMPLNTGVCLIKLDEFGNVL